MARVAPTTRRGGRWHSVSRTTSRGRIRTSTGTDSCQRAVSHSEGRSAEDAGDFVPGVSFCALGELESSATLETWLFQKITG